jgi:hypothetical protein
LFLLLQHQPSGQNLLLVLPLVAAPSRPPPATSVCTN